MKLKSKKIQEVLDALDQQESIQKWNAGLSKGWKFSFHKDFYDTDFYQLRLGRLWIVYGPYGLPRILCDR